jgi:lysozyme
VGTDAATASLETSAAEPEPRAETPVVQPFAAPTEVEPLVLSAPDENTLSIATPAVATLEERQDAAEPGDGGLFGEDLSLTQGGGPIMRHGDVEATPPASFDWSETGAFIIMGAVGLTAFGAAMAAFRLASEQTGGNETTIIAWVLAVIGAGCVGVSSFNLYRRWGLPGGDN